MNKLPKPTFKLKYPILAIIKQSIMTIKLLTFGLVISFLSGQAQNIPLYIGTYTHGTN